MRLHARVRTRTLIGAVTAVVVSTMLFAGPAHADPPVSGTGEDGAWSIETVEGGYKITLQLAEPLPVRDAIPELAVDGASLGPAVESPDGTTLTIITSDPDASAAASVNVAWNGEVPSEAAPTAMIAPKPAPLLQKKPGASPLPIDPAAPGRYTVVHDEYNLGDTAITLAGLGGRQAEIRAKVYLPKEATGRLPLVVFQHGRHSACYNPVTRQTSNNTWPCPAGQQPILSFTGLRRPRRRARRPRVRRRVGQRQRRQRRRQYVQRGPGALARGEVVMRHLDLLADATKGTGDGKLVELFKDRLDMDDIGLMGHSRGGEGVVHRRADQRGLAKPYGIKAVLPLAPVDFARRPCPTSRWT